MRIWTLLFKLSANSETFVHIGLQEYDHYVHKSKDQNNIIFLLSTVKTRISGGFRWNNRIIYMGQLPYKPATYWADSIKELFNTNTQIKEQIFTRRFLLEIVIFEVVKRKYIIIKKQYII